MLLRSRSETIQPRIQSDQLENRSRTETSAKSKQNQFFSHQEAPPGRAGGQKFGVDLNEKTEVRKETSAAERWNGKLRIFGELERFLDRLGAGLSKHRVAYCIYHLLLYFPFIFEVHRANGGF